MTLIRPLRRMVLSLALWNHQSRSPLIRFEGPKIRKTPFRIANTPKTRTNQNIPLWEKAPTTKRMPKRRGRAANHLK